jgi:RimJ/RimL family protein N-acetyltransferase
MDLTGIDLTTEVVRTERLVLRPYRPEDEDAVLRACQEPEIQRWNLSIPVPYTRDVARAWVTDVAPRVRADGHGMPAVIEAEGRLVGSTGVEFGGGLLGPAIGYWVAPWARGLGYAAEAARGMAEWAFRHGEPRVHLFADVANGASRTVAERAGFSREGIVRSCLPYRDGTRADAVLFGRVAGD